MTGDDGTTVHPLGHGAARARRWGTLVALALCLAVLVRLGHGSLAAPPVLHPARLGSWAADRDGPTMAVAGLRSLAVVGAGYLLGLTALALIVQRFRPGRAAWLTRVAPPAVRVIVASIVGAGLTASIGAASVLPAAAGPAAGPSSPVRPAAGTTVSPSRTAPLLRLVDEEPPPVAMTVDDPAPVSSPLPTWTVAPGDHFWRTAERVLHQAWGRTPETAETEAYWSTLVAHNRERLAVAGDADLVYPGQVFELPPAPPDPTARR